MGGGALPKQFMKVGEKPIILHTIEKFLACDAVDGIVIGVHGDWISYLQELLEAYGLSSAPICLCAGGANRNETVHNMLDTAEKEWSLSADAIIVTHDAVRPFVSPEIICENIRQAKIHGICGTAIPAVDTIYQSADGGLITDFPVRAQMYQAQTPQSFRLGLFQSVYDGLSAEELEAATDVCRLFYGQGYPVPFVKGDAKNFKITYPLDLQLAECLI